MIADIPARRIVRAIADAAQRWSDADFPPRVRATAHIVARTGYSEPVVDYALDRLFFDLTQDALEATITSELGSIAALDGFVARPGRPDALAAPAGRVCVISSRTTIGVALYPALFALCAKCDVTVKDREDQFIAAFFETLVQEDSWFAGHARAQTWDSTSNTVDLSSFDAVVAFGSDETLHSIRAAGDANARFIGYGARASAGFITAASLQRSADRDALAQGAARDLVLYETEGCLSLHLLFLEVAPDGHEHEEFLQSLARSTQAACIEFPAGRLEPEQTARRSALRAAGAFRAALGAGSVFTEHQGGATLFFDPSPDEPPPFAPRSLAVIPVGRPADALQYLRRHAIALEGFALSEPRADAIDLALSAGAVRLAPFGELQRPPVAGNHGGRSRIADFVRWIDKEI